MITRIAVAALFLPITLLLIACGKKSRIWKWIRGEKENGVDTPIPSPSPLTRSPEEIKALRARVEQDYPRNAWTTYLYTWEKTTEKNVPRI